MLVTKKAPFWAGNTRAVEQPSMYPNHTLCGLGDFNHLYALDHAGGQWVSPLDRHDCWAYWPLVSWLCYPGSEPYDRIMAAVMAVQMGASRAVLHDTLKSLCGEVRV